MRRRMAAVLAGLALLAGACGDDDDTGTVEATTTTEVAGPQTFPVRVDAKTESFANSWIHFFPSKLKARPGDTVEFTGEFTGEPHTVMTGTVVKEGLEAFATFEEESKGDEEAEPPPEVQALFDKIPPAFNEDPEATNFIVQAGAQPCFSATEDPPTKEACPDDKQQQADEFTGKERFVNSGFLADEDVFKVKLADDIVPGTYTFICSFHGPEMSEEVTVVAEGTDVPSPEEVRAAGQKELDGFIAKAKPAADKVVTSTSKDASAGAFLEEEGFPSAGINVFPTEVPIKAGEAVTWTVNGFHTMSFNAPEDARPWIRKQADGQVTQNEKSIVPTNSPKITPPQVKEGEGEDGPPPQVKVNGGKYDGKAFLNTGFPPNVGQLVYSLTFTNPGTYTYICLVHPDMEGTVKVT